MRRSRQMRIQLSEEQAHSFRIYMNHLLLWNPRSGLISSRDEHRVMSRHFLDSLCLFTVMDIRDGARFLDIGSGGGFPGLPLKICRPETYLTILEPKEKRYFFLKSLVKLLGLKGVNLYCQRAQDFKHGSSMHEGFDLVLARAIGGMEKMVSICFPFVREGGIFVAYKGRRVEGEVAGAAKQIERAGGELQGAVPVKIPGVEASRYLVLTSKPCREKRVR